MPWNPNLPLGTTPIRDSDEIIRNNWAAIQECLQTDHVVPGLADAGSHRKITLLSQGGDPDQASTKGFVYIKQINNITELFFASDGAPPVQLTNNGAVGNTVALTNNINTLNTTFEVEHLSSGDASAGRHRVISLSALPVTPLPLPGFARLWAEVVAGHAEVFARNSDATFQKVQLTNKGFINIADLNAGTGIALSTNINLAKGAVVVGIAPGHVEGIIQATMQASYLPSGTKTYFYQDVAPTGWIVDATVNDVLLAVKGGGQAYNGAGGAIRGTWQQAGTVLTTAQLPTHTHEIKASKGPYIAPNTNWVFGFCESQDGFGGTAYLGYRQDASRKYADCIVSSVGSNEAHNHGSIWRPAAAVGIICSKN